jgi:hypothetical protein
VATVAHGSGQQEHQHQRHHGKRRHRKWGRQRWSWQKGGRFVKIVFYCTALEPQRRIIHCGSYDARESSG